jgi:hypothetical protein
VNRLISLTPAVASGFYFKHFSPSRKLCKRPLRAGSERVDGGHIAGKPKVYRRVAKKHRRETAIVGRTVAGERRYSARLRAGVRTDSGEGIMMLPTKAGFYWAKWSIAAEGTRDGGELTPSDQWMAC